MAFPLIPFAVLLGIKIFAVKTLSESMTKDEAKTAMREELRKNNIPDEIAEKMVKNVDEKLKDADFSVEKFRNAVEEVSANFGEEIEVAIKKAKGKADEGATKAYNEVAEILEKMAKNLRK